MLSPSPSEDRWAGSRLDLLAHITVELRQNEWPLAQMDAAAVEQQTSRLQALVAEWMAAIPVPDAVAEVGAAFREGHLDPASLLAWRECAQRLRVQIALLRRARRSLACWRNLIQPLAAPYTPARALTAIPGER
jgi:hypothetical protein